MIHLTTQHLMTIYYVSDTGRGSGDTAARKIAWPLPSRNSESRRKQTKEDRNWTSC